MDVRQLRYVVAITEEANFTRAASRCDVAQPAMSQQVRRLETELGVRLFDRTTRRVQPTDAGLLLAARARRVLAELEDAVEELAELRDGRSGSLVLGVTAAPGPVDVVGLVAAFDAARPGVRLEVREQLSVEVLAGVACDVLHVGVFGGRHERPDGVEVVTLASEPLVALVPPQHRLAAREHLELADLADEPLVAFPPTATIRKTVTAAARDAGFTPRIAFETRDLARARAMTSAGLGIAVVPRTDATRAGAPVAVCALADLHHDISVCRRAGRRLPPAAEAFWQLALHSASGRPPAS